MKLIQNKLIFGKRLCARSILAALTGGLLLGILILTNVSDVTAQKKGRTPKKSSVKKPNKDVLRTENIESTDNLCIPQQTENQSIIQIDANSKLTVTAQTKNNSKILGNAESLSSLSEILSRIDKKSAVTVKADSALIFQSVVETLHNIRRITQNCVNVETSAKTDSQYVYISPEPLSDDNMNVKPNPLTLVVELKTDKKITLNTGDQGSLDDTSTVSNILKQIFSEREANGAFRQGTNEIEKTVFVKAPLNARFGDVIKLIEAIKEAGASPVGLQIDDLQ